MSKNQAKTPGTGEVEFVIHDLSYIAGNRISVLKLMRLPFDPTQDFHVYGFDWYPGRCDFFIDDVLAATIKTGDLGRINIGGNAVYRSVTLPTEATVKPSFLRLSNWTDLVSFTGVPPSAPNTFEVDWVSYTPFFFTAGATKLSVGAGGTIPFELNAGPGRAGMISLILGSDEWDQPGLSAALSPRPAPAVRVRSCPRRPSCSGRPIPPTSLASSMSSTARGGLRLASSFCPTS